jgi:hypothetical protein
MLNATILARVLALMQALVPGDPVVIAREAIQPHLAALPGGGFAAVFLRNGDVEISVSRDGGRTWTAPVVAIDARGKARGGMQRGPRIAADREGAIFVSFDETGPAKRYPVNELWLSVSRDGGRRFSPPLRLNDAPGKAPESLHALAAGPGGDVFVAWLDLRAREKGQDLAWTKVLEGGSRAAPNRILPGPLCECCAPGLAVDPKGNPLLLYRESRAGSRGAFLARSEDGGNGFGRIERINRGETKIDVCPMDAPAVAVSNDGRRLAAAWMDLRAGGRDVYWTVGEPGRLPPETLAHDDTRNAQGHPSLAFDAAGIAWCAWGDSRRGPNEPLIYVADSKRRRNVALSTPAEGKAGYPSLAASEAILGAVYEAGGGVSFRLVPAE